MLPVIIIISISNEEMKNYDIKKIEFIETAYGDIFQVEQNNIRENVVINATAIPNNVTVIQETDNIIWSVDEEEEIEREQIIGYRDKIPVKANINGIVKKIDKNCLILYTFEDIVWKTEVSEQQVGYFKNNLQDKRGNKVNICSISNRVHNGKISIKFRIENTKMKSGQKLKKLKLYTDNIFKNVLTIDKKCIAKKDGKYYVRVVDAQGRFLFEQQVEVGYESDGKICITGLEEGEFCDGGFSKYIGFNY